MTATAQNQMKHQANMHIYQSAAAFIHYAENGTEKEPEDLLPILTSTLGSKCFIIHSKMETLLLFCAYFIIFLSIFHRHPWTYSTYSQNMQELWTNDDLYPKFGTYIFLPITSAIILLPLVFILLVGILLEIGYKIDWKPSNHNWLTKRDILESLFVNFNKKTLKFNIIFRIILLLSLILNVLLLFYAFILYFFGYDHDLSFTYAAHLSSWVGMVLAVWLDKKTHYVIEIISRALPRFILLVLIGFIFVILFGFCGYSLFYPGENNEVLYDVADPLDNKPFFGSLNYAIWTVFVMLTSSSFPNQLIPAYTDSRISILYFFTFLSIGHLILLNIILAFVVIDYSLTASKLSIKRNNNRLSSLQAAFELLDTHRRGFLDYFQMLTLIGELFHHHGTFRTKHSSGLVGYISASLTGGYFSIPPSYTKQLIIVSTLDTNGDGKITFEEFSCILSVLELSLQLKTKNENNSHYWSIFILYVSEIIENGNFLIFTDTLRILLIVIALSISGSDFNLSYHAKILLLISSISSLFAVIVRLTVSNWKKFLMKFFFRLEAYLSVIYMTFCAFIFTNVEFVDRIIKVMMVVWIILYLTKVKYFLESTYRKQLGCELNKIAVNLFNILKLFFLMAYLFSLIGILCFGGLISKDSENKKYLDLNKTAYSHNEFYPLNFNDILSSLVTLFSCLVVSSFDIVADGMVSVTTGYSRIFFALWFIIGVLLFLNIFKSVFVRVVLCGDFTNQIKQFTKSLIFYGKNNKREYSTEGENFESMLNFNFNISLSLFKNNVWEVCPESINRDRVFSSLQISPNPFDTSLTLESINQSIEIANDKIYHGNISFISVNCELIFFID